MTRQSGGGLEPGVGRAGPAGGTVILLMAGFLAGFLGLINGAAGYPFAVIAAGLIGAALFRPRSGR